MWLGLCWAGEADCGNQSKAPHRPSWAAAAVPQHTQGTGGGDQKGLLEIATIPRGPLDGRLKGNLPVQGVTGSGIHPRLSPAGEGETCKWGKEFQRS